MQRKVYIALFSLVAVAAMTVGYFGFASADNDKDKDKRMVEYEVTVTNITRGAGTDSGQILGGLVVATHNSDFNLFTLGQAASDELAALAEDAHTDPLVNALSGNTNVKDVSNPAGVILPGASASVKISADRRHKYLSLGTMLVTTNDAFAALNGVALPKRSSEYFAVAYDAGSEANTESCTDIPGPPCGNPDVRVIVGAEGYVSVHSGIHGIGDPLAEKQILPEDRDWRNPVAWITIKRLSKDKD